MPIKQKNPIIKSEARCSIPSQQKLKAFLRELPAAQQFRFYEDVGRPTGHVATSLLDLCAKLASAQSPQAQASLTFHTRRGDFAAWIREAIGDLELADKISQISPDDRRLVKKLHKTVDERVKQLKAGLVDFAIIPEDQRIMPSVEQVR
jgi:ribosomal protein RSM22 (predicted rRNA methylase)